MSKPVVYSEAEVRHWLQWLARNMQKHGQTIFLVEQLQPSWFVSRGQTLLYLLVSNTLRYGMLMLLGTISFNSLASGKWQPQAQLVAVAAFGFVGFPLAMADVLGANTKDRSIWSGVLGVAGFFVSCVVLINVFMDAPGGNPMIFRSMAVALITVGMAAWRARRPIENYVQPVERITLSWKASWRALFGGWWGWPTVIYLVACCPLIYFLKVDGFLIAVLVFFLHLCYRIVKGCMNLVESQTVGTKTRPNEGIRLSWSSSLYLLRPAMAVLALAGVAAFTKQGDSGTVARLIQFAGSPLVALSLMLSAWHGGIDVLDHFLLRWMLRLYGYAPLSYPAFLDYAATELGFLQKVGGGYMFMHRYLLEYFAMPEPPPVVATGPVVPSRT